ncbi:SIT4 phosphatase-associated protein-domain-containing protein [Chytridium lagenaria]|nr:SIT4 phosphatase-associated protein-domain-containing protein [Chytridium lagenaria]
MSSVKTAFLSPNPSSNIVKNELSPLPSLTAHSYLYPAAFLSPNPSSNIVKNELSPLPSPSALASNLPSTIKTVKNSKHPPNHRKKIIEIPRSSPHLINIPNPGAPLPFLPATSPNPLSSGLFNNVLALRVQHCEEELLQECKSHNAKLVEFLTRPNVISSLLTYVIAEDLEEAKKFKIPFIACEIFSCEIYSVCEAAITNTELMIEFWKFLDREAPLNALQASYFSKVNNVFFQKKAGDMVNFVKTQPNVVSKLLNHIGTSAIADLLLKIISVEEVPEGQGVVKWLAEQNLVANLIDRLEPEQDMEIHNTASQTVLDIIAVSYQNLGPMEHLAMGDGASLSGGNLLVDELKSAPIMGKLVGYMLDKNAKNSTSTLTNGINIIIELIRRYCSEIEQAEYQQHQSHSQMQITRMANMQFNLPGPPLPSDEKLCALATDLNDLLSVIGTRLPEFANLLTSPRNKSEMDTTAGKQTPLGSERLKTCELFAEVLHLQYLYTFLAAAALAEAERIAAEDGADVSDESKEVEKKVEVTESLGKEDVTVSDELAIVTERFVDTKILPMCLELFFQYPWNNFLHSVVYDMIAKVFNTYSSRAPPTSGPLLPRVRCLNLQHRFLLLKRVKEGEGKRVQASDIYGKLTERIMTAQRNDEKVADYRHSIDVSDAWQTYLMAFFVKLRNDRQPLGGVRPTQTSQPLSGPMVSGIGAFGAGGTTEDADMGATLGVKGDGEGAEEEEEEVTGVGELGRELRWMMERAGEVEFVRGLVDWPDSNNYD